ncbi:MAG TPA: O-antigen ligase family protein [Candidatus Dormibacteraeota bacterium]|nr:O-antigen ligase family protein [Candidatus Dormibacteraeota bacterium]
MAQRTHFAEFSRTGALRFSDAAILAASIAVGIALCVFLESPSAFLCRFLAIAGVSLLLLYPECALAAYVVIGDVKGSEAVASLFPFDLTLALGAVLLAGIALNLFRRRRPLSFPPVYLAFAALVAMMAASLFYAPEFAAGFDKLGRFLTVTGIVIIAPFYVLNTPSAMKRFLIGFGVAAFAICAWSLSNLGSTHRLVSPSDNTIGLGHVACALFVLIWIGIIARNSLPRRVLAYPLLAVAAVALLGSASRGSAIACALVVIVSVAWNRKLLVDVACLITVGIGAIPFLGIPGASISYLSTLVRSQSIGDLLNFRADLLEYGWKLFEQHPLIGAGLAGYRYLSPNPTLYKWPHNIFLEVACELGIPGLLLVLAIFGSAIRESLIQLRDQLSSYTSFSQITAALLLVGLVNAVNTGNINSDRSTWLFVSLVFAVRAFRARQDSRVEIRVPVLVGT